MGHRMVRGHHCMVRRVNYIGLQPSRRAEITPWDAGTIQPPLADLIESSTLVLPKTGRALVPGCGRVSLAIVRAVTLCRLTHCCVPCASWRGVGL